MIHRHSPGSTRRLTLGADKGYDAADFVRDLRKACVTPHVAQKARHSAIDRRTTPFTLTATFADGTESPHSAPFAFTDQLPAPGIRSMTISQSITISQ